jgi:hypothetical protein
MARQRLAPLPLLLIAVPWIEIGYPMTALVAALASWTLYVSRGLYRSLQAVAAVVLGAAIVAPLQPRMTPIEAPISVSPNVSVDASWSAFMRASNPDLAHQYVALVLAVPTWIALVVLLIAFARFAHGVRPRRDRPLCSFRELRRTIS